MGARILRLGAERSQVQILPPRYQCRPRVAGDRGEADALVYPIVLCFRQYLELVLKDTLRRSELSRE